MFKGSDGFPKIINLCMNLVIGIAISFVLLAVAQNQPGNEGLPILTPIAVVQSLVLSFCIGYAGGDRLPIMNWGQKLADILRLKGKISSYVVISIVLGLVMGVVILFVVSFINNILTQGMVGVISFFIQLIPLVILMAVTIVLLLLKPAMIFATKVSGFDPANANPANATNQLV